MILSNSRLYLLSLPAAHVMSSSDSHQISRLPEVPNRLCGTVTDETLACLGVRYQPRARMGCCGDLTGVDGRMPIRHQRGAVVPAALRLGPCRHCLHWGAH